MTVTVTEQDEQRLVEWREIVRAIIRMDPEMAPDYLKIGVRSLAAAAVDRYPAFERGEQVALDGEEMGIGTLLLETTVFNALLIRTGAVLFTGVDGPPATAEQMVEEIEYMADGEL